MDFKILLLVYKALNTRYISDSLVCYEESRCLRLSGMGFLSVRRVETKRTEASELSFLDTRGLLMVIYILNKLEFPGLGGGGSAGLFFCDVGLYITF